MQIILLSTLATAATAATTIFGLDVHDTIQGQIRSLKRSSSMHVCSGPVFSSQEEIVSSPQGEAGITSEGHIINLISLSKTAEQIMTRRWTQEGKSASSEKSSGADPVLLVLSQYDNTTYAPRLL